MLEQFLSGSIFMSCLVICLYFLRFWQKTGDRLFLYFTAAFAVFMAERIVRSTMEGGLDWAPYIYSLRLAGFILLLLGIVEKNRRS